MTTRHTDERTLPAELQARLDHLGTLAANWDSYGAEPISPDAIALAKSLLCRTIATLQRMGAANLYPFAIAPLSDGGVQLEWRSGRGFAEIEISPSGMLSALVGGDGSSSPTHTEHPNISADDAAAMLASLA